MCIITTIIVIIILIQQIRNNMNDTNIRYNNVFITNTLSMNYLPKPHFETLDPALLYYMVAMKGYVEVFSEILLSLLEKNILCMQLHQARWLGGLSKISKSIVFTSFDTSASIWPIPIIYSSFINCNHNNYICNFLLLPRSIHLRM